MEAKTPMLMLGHEKQEIGAMGHITAQTIGQWRTVSFKVAQLDVVTADVDLLVVGMFEQDIVNQPKGGADQLDRVLHGTLGRLREGGIFKGMAGETLMLSAPPAPIEARSLMLIGMGNDLSASYSVIGHPTELAMRTALCMQARSAGCLLAWLERDIPSEMVEASAATMMQGALKAIDEHADTEKMPVLEWIFDIRNGDASRTAAALGRALNASS